MRFAAFEPGDPSRGVVLEIDLEPSHESTPRLHHSPAALLARLPGRSLAWHQLVLDRIGKLAAGSEHRDRP